MYFCGMAKKKTKTGRKKVDPANKVILLGFYTKRSNIDAVGGMDKARTLCKEMFENQNKILA